MKSDEFILREFNYFLGDASYIAIKVFYSNDGEFMHFMLNLDRISDEEIFSKDILIGIRNFLIGLELDLK